MIEQFEILEIKLPVITGDCTIGGSDGFGTPLYCDQDWSGEYKSYYFTNVNAPIIPSVNGEPVYRCISSIRENPPEIKPSEGLSSRGSASISFLDFKGDPNKYAKGVTEEVISNGSFFGKLSIRNILENKEATLRLYTKKTGDVVDLSNYQSRNYLINTISPDSKNSSWSLSLKDSLSILNIDEKSWPIYTGGFLRSDIDDTTTSIPVDGDTDYSNAFAVRVSDELMEIVSVTDNLTTNATLTVKNRNSAIIAPNSGKILSVAGKSSHSAGDEVFICELSDDEEIDSLIARILTDSGLDSSLIPLQEWREEIQEWHPTSRINTLHSESEDVNDAIKRILEGFLLDLWYEPTDKNVKLSAISVWKESTQLLTEGKEIDSYSISKSASDSIRATRAYVVYDKPDLTKDDETSSYKKASIFSDDTLIGPELYVEHKDKVFGANRLIDTEAANLLTQRYVSRFKFTPFVRQFTTPEKYLSFKTGDVVDIVSSVDQNADGTTSTNVRGQVTQIKPEYGKAGRNYKVRAMTYEAAFNQSSEIVISSPVSSANLHILAGAPSQPVELTFVFDGSYSYGDVAIRSGRFAAGSKLIIILANGFDGQASGGKGGTGQSIEYDQESDSLRKFPAQNGFSGGVVFDAEGVNCDIYFSGNTPSTLYPEADGTIRAPSGGDGGHFGTGNGLISGNGGNGGDGRAAGAGGAAGFALGGNIQKGVDGLGGTETGELSGFGSRGNDNGATGGAAGSGIINSGAIVNLFGINSTNYINGNGDH